MVRYSVSFRFDWIRLHCESRLTTLNSIQWFFFSIECNYHCCLVYIYESVLKYLRHRKNCLTLYVFNDTKTTLHIWKGNRKYFSIQKYKKKSFLLLQIRRTWAYRDIQIKSTRFSNKFTIIALVLGMYWIYYRIKIVFYLIFNLIFGGKF